MIGSKRRVRSNHASYHFMFTKAACTDLYRNFSSSKMHCGSTQKTAVWTRRLECSVDHRASHIISACHRSCIRKEKAKINLGREIIMAISRNSGVFCNAGPVIIFTAMVSPSKIGVAHRAEHTDTRRPLQAREKTYPHQLRLCGPHSTVLFLWKSTRSMKEYCGASQSEPFA